MTTESYIDNTRSPAELAALVAAHGFEVGQPATIVRTVLDSFDGRLYEAGLRLEFQRGATTELVLAAAGSISATVASHRIPRFATDLPAGPFRPRIAPALEMRALLPTVSFTDVVTDVIERDASGSTVVRLAIHEPVREPSFAAGADVPTVVEVLQLAGHPKRAIRAGSLLEELGLRRSELGLVDLVLAGGGIDPAGFNSSPTVDLDKDMHAIDGCRAVFENLASSIGANWQGTIDDVDTEFLHELRVAVRRTRSVLGHGRHVLDESVRQRYRDEFAWLAVLTGPTRDLDVYILEWDRYVGHLSKERISHLEPVLLHLQRHRARAYAELVSGLQSARAGALLRSWAQSVRRPEMGAEAAAKAHLPLGGVVVKRIRKAHETLVDNGRRITSDSPSESLHDLRKDAKKLRYAVECFGGLLPSAARKAFVRQLKGLQDNLGEHQDAEVHAAELEAVAHELSADAERDTLLALGQLTEHLELSKREARSEFVRRFGDYHSKETREILDRLLEPIDQR